MSVARRATAFVAVALVLGWWTSPTAGAVQPGACTDRTGVTVVVDFTDLGGGVVVRCAGTLSDRADGFAALAAAGFEVAQPLRTPGFVCRIDAQPAPSAEACVDTPPTSAYWSYWTAERGGAWRYSSLGASARTVQPGGVEGWAFAEDRAARSVPAPRTAPPGAPTTTAPPPPHGQPGAAGPTPTAPSIAPPPPGRTAVAGVTTTRPAGSAGPAPTTPTGEPVAPTTSAVEPGTNTTSTAASGATTTTSAARPDRVEVAAAASRDADTGGGSGAATAAAVVLIAALGAGAVTTARRRSSRADDDR